MTAQALDAQLRWLIMELSAQEIKKGNVFVYDNNVFFADDVADTLLPSILVLAQHLAEKLGIGSFGYRFKLTEKPNPLFPLAAELPDKPPPFPVLALFVQHVFETEVMAYRHDLVRLFETAVRLLDTSHAPVAQATDIALRTPKQVH